MGHKPVPGEGGTGKEVSNKDSGLWSSKWSSDKCEREVTLCSNWAPGLAINSVEPGPPAKSLHVTRLGGPRLQSLPEGSKAAPQRFLSLRVTPSIPVKLS